MNDAGKILVCLLTLLAFFGMILFVSLVAKATGVESSGTENYIEMADSTQNVW